MLKDKSFWEQAKNIPSLLISRVNQLLDAIIANDETIDDGLQDLLGQAQVVGTPVIGATNVEIPNGIIVEFSFIDRTSTAITGFLPNTENVIVIPNGQTGGIVKKAGTHYIANPTTGKITFVPPFIPVAGDALLLNCHKGITISIDNLEQVDINKWNDPNYEEA